MRIAVLGGSFNPIHIGNLFLADEVCTRLGYDRVYFVLANIRRIEDSMVILMEFLQYLFLLLHLRRYQPNIYQISLQLAFPTDDRYDIAS